MKILFLTSSSVWSQTLPLGFQDARHEVLVSGPLTKDNLSPLIQQFAPNLIVTMGWGAEQQLDQQTFIRTHIPPSGIPHVYWATEDPNFTEEFTLPLIQNTKPNFVFTTCAQRVSYYEQRGIQAAHLDFGFQPRIHRRSRRRSRFYHNIAIIANAYPDVFERYPQHYRMKAIRTLIRPLVKQKIRVDFYGRDWDKMSHLIGAKIPSDWIHGPLPYADAYKVYNSARIIIGLQNYEDSVTMRTYEILASGGFLLTMDTQGVRSLVTPGKDLIVSSSSKETVRLVHRYLKASELRRRIRHYGRLTIQPHSYTARTQQMVEVLRTRGIVG